MRLTLLSGETTLAMDERRKVWSRRYRTWSPTDLRMPKDTRKITEAKIVTSSAKAA